MNGFSTSMNNFHIHTTLAVCNCNNGNIWRILFLIFYLSMNNNVDVQELSKQETAYLSIFCEKIEKKNFSSLSLPLKHIICISSLYLVVIKKTVTEWSNNSGPISSSKSYQSPCWINLDCIKRMINHLGFEDRSFVVVEDIPRFHNAILSRNKKGVSYLGSQHPSLWSPCKHVFN